MKASRMVCMAGVFLAVSSFNAQAAGISIQSVQYKANKGVLFVKGKSDAETVYVVNEHTGAPIGEISVRNGDFRSDMPLGPFTGVPCSVEIQTKSVTQSVWGTGTQTVTDSRTSDVRHAPDDCVK